MYRIPQYRQLAILALLAVATTSFAATFTWDDGAGNNRWNNALNWDTDTVPDNDGTAIIDATAATSASIFLVGDRDIDELRFGGGAISIKFTNQVNELTLRTALRRLSTVTTNIDTLLAIGADGVVFENAFGGTYRFNNTVTDNGNGYDWIIDGNLEFRGSSWDAPSPFSGQIVQTSGSMTVRADHAFTSAASWHLGGTITLADAGDKIGDSAPVTLYNGAIRSFGAAEDVGALTLASGICTFWPRISGAIQADSLTRGATPGTRALCRLQDVNATNYVKLDSTASLGLIGGDGSRTTNKPIVPHIYDYAAINNQFRTLITYDVTNGLSELDTTTEFVRASAATFPAVNADGNDNVLLSFTDAGSATVTLTGDTTVNALVVYVDDANASHFLDLGGFTLTIKSGLFIANNDLSANNDRLQVQNGTIDTGSAEMIVLSTMGAANNGLEFNCALTGTDGVTVHNSHDPVNFGLGPNLSTITLIEGRDMRVSQGAFADDAVLVGSQSSFNATRNILRAAQFGASVLFSEVHGTLTLKHGHSTRKGDEGVVIGGAAGDHVRNHIRLLGSGILSPHGTSLSHSANTQLDGGVIGLSAYDKNNDNHPTDAFTVDLHAGQVLIDIFADDNYDQIRVIASEFGDANLSLDAGGGTGSELVVRLHSVPDAADTFTIVDVDGATAITGTFSNGNIVKAGSYVFDISYTGGDGNDIVLSNARPANGTTIRFK